jgi:hypothetical protein
LTAEVATAQRRWYRCGGITVQVTADLPFRPDTFHPKFEAFRVDGPGEETIAIHHRFSLPRLDLSDLGSCIHRAVPWAVYTKDGTWQYIGILPTKDENDPFMVASFNEDHSDGQIAHPNPTLFQRGNLHTLTCFPSDQILLARVLADRQGCYLHSSGVLIDGQGMLFLGKSGAGKSTLLRMALEEFEPLCDDRNVVRLRQDGYWVYGSWSHGELPIVSPKSAPLRAIFFLEQANAAEAQPVPDMQSKMAGLLESLIRPIETRQWWENSLEVLEGIARYVPCYRLRFDLSGAAIVVLREIAKTR